MTKLNSEHYLKAHLWFDGTEFNRTPITEGADG